MKQYKCKNCGYMGSDLIFQFNSYGYCLATNGEEPKYLSEPPDWVRNKTVGDAEIEEPVGCPKCHAWSISNFEKI